MAMTPGLEGLADAALAVLRQKVRDTEAELRRVRGLVHTMASGKWLVMDYEDPLHALQRAIDGECSLNMQDHPLGSIERYYPSCTCGWRSDPTSFPAYEEAKAAWDQHNRIDQ